MTQQERSRNAWKKWQELVSEQARSGQSVAAFCRGAEVVRAAFFLVEEAVARKFAGEVRGSESDAESVAASERGKDSTGPAGRGFGGGFSSGRDFAWWRPRREEGGDFSCG